MLQIFLQHQIRNCFLMLLLLIKEHACLVVLELIKTKYLKISIFNGNKS